MISDIDDVFPGRVGSAYFNTASQALGNAPGAAALRRATDEWLAGRFDWGNAESVGGDLRGLCADLLHVSSDDIAFVTGVSGAASTVASQLPAAPPAANVVLPARDFSSNMLAWLALERQGYEIRMVDAADGDLGIDIFAAAVDADTALIATSLVQSATGYRVPVDELKTLAADHGAWLVLDASQAFGCVEIDVSGITALYSCSHKWMCGIRGMGYLYADPDVHESFRALTPGWKSTQEPMQSFYGPDLELARSAARLDASTPWFDPLVNIEGMRIIASAGIGNIARHNMSLVDRLASAGLDVAFRPECRSPIVSVDIPDAESRLARLEDAGVAASVRDGRLRVSFHLYNDEDDVDLLISLLR
ncbi:MAG: aminotransferase class V [Acidimicrobiales bacterium]|nr:MAG: aminotransferase class V [Acidimicrobiales bacterium]